MVRQSVEAYVTARKAKAAGPAAEVWANLETLYVEKQWYQLTEALKAALKDPAFTKGLDLMEMHKEFIANFQGRINVLALVEILGPIAASVPAAVGLAFLDETKTRLAKDLAASETKSNLSKEALVLCNAYMAQMKLNVKDSKGKVQNIQEIRNLVEETGRLVEELSGVTAVHGDFHKAYAAYLCEVADHAGYYREALRYLACVQLSGMSPADQKLLSQRLCLSALLGKNVYNFGELLAHPILKCLDGAREQWLLDLVKVFNAGDMEAFDASKAKWSPSYDIKANEAALRAKLRLLAVMQAAFQRPASDRNISFADLAKRLKVPEDQVEVLVMKALAQGLVKGHIDQVDHHVHFDWVMPRVLDKPLIGKMQDRILLWSTEVKKTSDFVSANAKDILIK